MSSVARKPLLGGQYGTAAAEKKDRKASFEAGLQGNFAPKPGFDLSVFWKRCVVRPGFCMTILVSRGAGGDRRLALDPDGGRLGGAAAHRQFRLGRYRLDLFARPGRRRQRAMAGRGRCQCAAMAGRGPGGDLVAAARRYRVDRRITAIPAMRHCREWGVDSPRDVLFLQNQSVRPISAACSDLCRGAIMLKMKEWSHELRFHDHRHRRTGAAA